MDSEFRTTEVFSPYFQRLITSSTPGNDLFKAWEENQQRFHLHFDQLPCEKMADIFVCLLDFKKEDPKVNPHVLNRCLVKIHKVWKKVSGRSSQ